ncbi:hypothetical protein RND81_05G179200 [Saponaria officinalis]|uniref:Uncharacterized protein n=1 Tax=Saponaria officinalis TaxID=3572 RepID=A0AAW1L238_SAPOF
MEFFKGAKFVRLRNEQNKYMVAHEDEEKVRQSRKGASNYAWWFVESVHRKQNAIRLKNRQTGKYLGASDAPFLLGMTAKRVIQTSLLPPRSGSDTCVDWTPIKEGTRIKLRTRGGDFLRANAGPPPWKNSITHDSVYINDSLSSFLWFLDVVDLKSADAASEIQSSYNSSSANQGASFIEARILDARNKLSFTKDMGKSAGPLNHNRWKILALVIKAIVKLRLLLSEAYKVQEKMKLHCCLLPSDYEFERDELIQLWMAAGYLSNERMEVYGRRYFQILLNKQMILFSGSDTSSGERKYLTNVPYETLQSQDADMFTILKDEFMAVEEMNAWHVSFVSDDINQTTFETLKRCKELRSLLFIRDYGPSLERVPSDIFLALHGLEALDLSGSHITELPSSIGNVRQLRYLNLSFTLIESLPESISSLHELQTLNLEGCKRLYALPKGFKKLVSLRHLYFDVLGQLSLMPRGIGGLTQLRTLSSFIVDNEDGCNIRELRCLNNLCGSCCISGLQNVTQDTSELLLLDKLLTHLQLRWSEYDSVDQNWNYVDVSFLEPHPCLEELQMLYYPCTKLPWWICKEEYTRLNSITLRNCQSIVLDIRLGRLPNLRYLYIIQMNRVETIDDSIHALPGEVSFPKLEKLTIDGMFSLISWTGVKSGDFPLLSELSIKHCPRIIKLHFLPFLGSLELLEIVDCTMLESLSNQELPNKLQTLMVDDCPLLNERYFGEGAEWCKIKHVQNIWFDLEDMHSLSADYADSELKVDDESRCSANSLAMHEDQNVSAGKREEFNPHLQSKEMSNKQDEDGEREKKLLLQIQLLKRIVKFYIETDIYTKRPKWLLPEDHGLDEETVEDTFSSMNNEIEALLAAPGTDYSEIVSELVNKNAKLQRMIRIIMRELYNVRHILLQKQRADELRGREHEACSTDSDVHYYKGSVIDLDAKVEEVRRYDEMLKQFQEDLI